MPLRHFFTGGHEDIHIKYDEYLSWTEYKSVDSVDCSSDFSHRERNFKKWERRFSSVAHRFMMTEQTAEHIKEVADQCSNMTMFIWFDIILSAAWQAWCKKISTVCLVVKLLTRVKISVRATWQCIYVIRYNCMNDIWCNTNYTYKLRIFLLCLDAIMSPLSCQCHKTIESVLRNLRSGYRVQNNLSYIASECWGLAWRGLSFVESKNTWF